MLAPLVDGLILVLLVAALALGSALYVRLRRWRWSGAELEPLIKSLSDTTDRAEKAFHELRVAARDADKRLKEDIEGAQSLHADLRLLSGRADAIADRLADQIGHARSFEPAAAAPGPATPTATPRSAAPAPESAAELERALRTLR